jgi:hypothetical protein
MPNMRKVGTRPPRRTTSKDSVNQLLQVELHEFQEDVPV